METKGIFIQQVFPFGAFGPRQWSLSEMRRLFVWLKKLGYTDAAFMAWSIFRREDEDHTILEHGGLYHSGLAAPPPFDPGFSYRPSDRYIGTSQGLLNAEHFRDQIRIANEVGLKPWLFINLTLGAPGYLEDHPELAAVNGGELFNEGTNFCPSKPEGMKHLLDFHADQVKYCDAVHGFALMPRDPGGCGCRLCMPQADMFARVSNAHHTMIRSLRPKAPIAFLSWHIRTGEVAGLADQLHQDISIFEAPRIHAMDAPEEEYIERVKEWQARGRLVYGWLETQENPTALLPSVYPRRVEKMVKKMSEMKMEGIWQTSAQNPYLFPLHFWMTPKLIDGLSSASELTREFLARSFGTDLVEVGVKWTELTETAWEQVLSMPQYEAGFLGLFVVTFPERLLPEKMMKMGVPDEVRTDLRQAVAAAQAAFEAAEDLASRMRDFHAQDANMIVVSAEVLARRIEMRYAKLDVLDAICAGDAEAAVVAWSVVERACYQMVSAARSAPNTDVLAKHWRRLSLLPRRLATIGQHIPELAERKAFRPIRQQLYIGEMHKEDSGKSKS
jgi:hypothetical protein